MDLDRLIGPLRGPLAAPPKPRAPERKFYSATARGFFSSHLHERMPEDVIEISHEEWEALLRAQCEGNVIRPDENGRPCARPLEVPIETRARNKRLARDRLLAATDGLIARHRDEIDSGFVPTLTAEKFSALQSWRHALRSITRDPGFPDINLPLKPEGL